MFRRYPYRSPFLGSHLRNLLAIMPGLIVSVGKLDQETAYIKLPILPAHRDFATLALNRPQVGRVVGFAPTPSYSDPPPVCCDTMFLVTCSFRYFLAFSRSRYRLFRRFRTVSPMGILGKVTCALFGRQLSGLRHASAIHYLFRYNAPAQTRGERRITDRPSGREGD